MLTLKQLADKISKEFNLSISKQAVQYHGDKLEISYHYNNGVKYLDEGQQQLIINRIKDVHLVNVESDASDNKNVEDREYNTQSNNSNDYESVIKQYEARIKDLKESHEKHIRDLNKQLDRKQETINNLTVSMTMQGLTNKPNNNEDNTRSVVSSGSNQSDNKDDTNTYEDAHTRSTDEDDTNVENVENVEDTNESSNDPIEDTKEAVENKKRKPWWKLW